MSTSFSQAIEEMEISRIMVKPPLPGHAHIYFSIWAEQGGRGTFIDLTMTEAQLVQIEEAIANFLHERAVSKLMETADA